MSLIHVQQIKGYLNKHFSAHIDISDCAAAPPEQKEKTLLTRSLAAFAISQLSSIDPKAAAQCVTDGTHDNGIDAVYYDKTENLLYLVQSKWHADGNGSVERGDIQKLIHGFKDIINTRFDRFNPKTIALKASIEAALYSTDTRFVITVIHTGQHDLAEEPKRDLDDLLKEMNDPSETVLLRVLKQDSVHSMIAAGTRGAPINLEVALSEWGQVKEPFQSVFGLVPATDIAKWWHQYHPRLLTPNVRMFLGKTEVNDSIIDTLRGNPENFWYFNNGITALCAGVRKKPLGGSSRESGVFEIDDVSIVNGAQTVGAIASAESTIPDQVAKARVLIRFISLKDCPPSFGTEITRFTNTQNRIEKRDFVALDPEQARIRTELQLEGVEYVYKSGDVIPKDRQGFDLEEAAVALACSKDDINLAVQSKREVGKLWEDISKAPYKALFNPTTSGQQIWNLVETVRAIEVTLAQARDDRSGRDRLFAIHGNRVVAWIVLRDIQEIGSGDQGLIIKDKTLQALKKITEAANDLYPDAYPANLFKNTGKCKEIAEYSPTQVQGDIFDREQT